MAKTTRAPDLELALASEGRVLEEDLDQVRRISQIRSLETKTGPAALELELGLEQHPVAVSLGVAQEAHQLVEVLVVSDQLETLPTLRILEASEALIMLPVVASLATRLLAPALAAQLVLQAALARVAEALEAALLVLVVEQELLSSRLCLPQKVLVAHHSVLSRRRMAAPM